MAAGSAEIRELLLYECDVIFECRICRSIFRGLPNFLAHKRSYCMTRFQDKQIEFVGDTIEESVIVVQPQDPDTETNEGILFYRN